MMQHFAEQSEASQDKFELWQLLELLSAVLPTFPVIVEIGVHNGRSMQTWHKAFRPYVLVGIDNDPGPDLEVPPGAVNLLDDSHHPAALAHLQNQLDGRLIDFLFIDGDHNYAGVKQDWEMYRELVKPGGIVAFHDIMRMPGQIEGVEVRRLFDEIKQDYKTIEIWNGSIEAAPGTGVVFV